MLWELLATIFAGFGAVGIVLTFKLITRITLARWIIPVTAGLGMFAFQIYSEYTWFQHQKNRLPEGVVVIRAIEESAIWRPWSYIYPQTTRFVAADISNAITHTHYPQLKRVDLYFFERRQRISRIPQVIDCKLLAKADFSEQLAPADTDIPNQTWDKLSADDAVLQVCL